MTALAIFVKTPGLSPLKTRLAADWGRDRAEQFHRLAATAVESLCLAADIGPVYWAVAEPASRAGASWPGRALIEQGGGDLGQRMGRVHTELVSRHGQALLLGADAPQIDPDWLARAAHWLDRESPRLCIGPSSDGGFWTIGANRALPMARWQSVRYSQADTQQQFVARMLDQGEWLSLPELTDLDRAGDLPALIEQLKALPQVTGAQWQLLTWLRDGAQP
jgi:rSAM/selenodomain-associated transferase 1